MNPRGFLLFDIDGVIRDVTGSYRRAIQETVKQFTTWKPSIENIDDLKAEGIWNNDWDTSLELVKRYINKNSPSIAIPDRKYIVEVFSNYYFGGDPNGLSHQWTGFIKNEPLIVNKDFFKELTEKGFLWGFVSGSEISSAKYVLETRIGLTNPPLIAMGEAPEKPDPSGLLRLASHIAKRPLGSGMPPIYYLGDTVTDVLTVNRAKAAIPNQIFFSYAVAPPHLHTESKKKERMIYEQKLQEAGADKILISTYDAINQVQNY